jgi:hypothetical protein
MRLIKSNLYQKDYIKVFLDMTTTITGDCTPAIYLKAKKALRPILKTNKVQTIYYIPEINKSNCIHTADFLG